MEGLGRLYNLTAPVADNVYISLRDASAVAFVCYLTTTVETYTLTSAQDAADTGSAVLAAITRAWTAKGDGSDAWVLHTQAAASTFAKTTAAAQNCVVIEVDVKSLPDGHDYVKLAGSGAGTISAVVHDLIVQRNPANLPALGV